MTDNRPKSVFDYAFIGEDRQPEALGYARNEEPIPMPDCVSEMPPGAEETLRPRPLNYKPCFINAPLAFGQVTIVEHLVKKHGGEPLKLACFTPDELWIVHDLLHEERRRQEDERIANLERQFAKLDEG